MSFQCRCGQSATQLSEVGLTTHHELVIRWRCGGCNQDVFVVKSLSDCWRECPAEEQEPRAREVKQPFSDAQFLRSMRVKFPDEAEA